MFGSAAPVKFQHPGPAYEAELERAARARAKELHANHAKLREKVAPADPRNLESICAEGAHHLGNCYYVEARLKKGVRGDDLVDELNLAVAVGRERFNTLSALAGRLISEMVARATGAFVKSTGPGPVGAMSPMHA